MRSETIGDATLYCGDCRDIIPNIKNVDCLITDPPYLVTSGGFGQLEGGFGGWIKDAYDNKGAIVLCDIDWQDWLKLIPNSLADNAHIYIFSNDRNLSFAQITAESFGLKFHRLLVWDKKTAMPNKWYQQVCEFILFMRKGKAFMINNPSSKSLTSIFQRDESIHPTEKPVDLCSMFVSNSTKPNQTVMDPFMGSGTTGVACAKLKRKFIGIELDKNFFDISCSRIEQAYKQKEMFSPEYVRFTEKDLFGGN